MLSSCSASCGCCCFFSSRRRHTISKRDWSSDVCSSDLAVVAKPALEGERLQGRTLARLRQEGRVDPALPRPQIGRASCRERVWITVGVGSLNDKLLS